MSSVNEWPMVRLGDLGRFISGGTPNRKRPEFYNGSIPWISSADISDAGEISTRRFITEEAIASSATKLVPAHTILIATRIGVGKVAIASEEICFSQDMVALVDIDETMVSSSFLKHMILITRPYLQGIARGVTIRGINISDLQRLEIPLPPLAEQQRIAEILDTSQNIERCQRHVIQSYTNLASQVVEDAVAKSSGTSLLEELATINGGLSLSKRRAALPLSLPYLRVANVFRNQIDLSEVKEIGCTPEEMKRTELLAGDILMIEAHGNRKEVGRVAVLQQGLDNFTYQNHLFRIRGNGKISPLALSYLLSSHAVRQQLIQLATTTSGLKTISISKVRRLQVPMLDQHIVSDLNDALERIRILSTKASKKLELFENLRHSLSRRAFAGQL